MMFFQGEFPIPPFATGSDADPLRDNFSLVCGRKNQPLLPVVVLPFCFGVPSHSLLVEGFKKNERI